MPRLIILPDTNCWHDPNIVARLTDLRNRRACEVAGYYPIAFECMTAENVSLSITALNRLVSTVSTWIRDKEEIISEVVGLARNDWVDELRVVQRPEEQEKTLDYWTDALRNIKQNHAYWRQSKKVWQAQKIIDAGLQTKKEFDAELRELHPDTELTPSHIKPIVERCLDPNDSSWGGALLSDSLVRRYNLSEEEGKKLLLSLTRFPGFRLFYCHTMWNFIGQANGRRIDPSFVQDAHMLLPVGSSCVLLTKDRKLRTTHREFHTGVEPLLFNEVEFLEWSSLGEDHKSEASPINF